MSMKRFWMMILVLSLLAAFSACGQVGLADAAATGQPL